MEDFQVTTADMLEIVLSGGNGAEYVNIAGLMEKAVNELREKDAENIRLREALSYYLARDEEKPYCWQHSRNDAEKMALIAMSNSSGMLTSSVVKDCLATGCPTRRQIIDERDKTFALMLARAEKAEAKVASLRKMVKDAYNDGFCEGMREVNFSTGGTPWSECKYRAALAEKEST